MSDAYDVTVLGAGIHGAGAAQAAAAMGYRTLVLEKTGIASGTSSRSSKLIHGGLRYLEQAEFGLVRECLRERELLLKLAPDLVQLRRFRIPLYKDTRRRPWQLHAGLSLYALLAGLGSHATYRTLPRREWDKLDGLDTADLQAVFEYQDGQTDDAGLTGAVLRSAESLGAELRMPACFDTAKCDANGVEIRYTAAGREMTCRSAVLINATGPWVAETAQRIEPLAPAVPIDLVQGAHLVLDLPARQSIYYLEVPEDGRAVFLMPWRGKSLLGTTERVYMGDPANAAPSEVERQYLLTVMKRYFPGTDYRPVSEFAGVRVLPRSSGRLFERGRELILEGDTPRTPRVLHLYGGKLTSYRADSEKIMARLKPALPQRKALADTCTLPLGPVT